MTFIEGEFPIEKFSMRTNNEKWTFCESLLDQKTKSKRSPSIKIRVADRQSVGSYRPV